MTLVFRCKHWARLFSPGSPLRTQTVHHKYHDSISISYIECEHADPPLYCSSAPVQDIGGNTHEIIICIVHRYISSVLLFWYFCITSSLVHCCSYAATSTKSLLYSHTNEKGGGSRWTKILPHTTQRHTPENMMICNYRSGQDVER
jgi:hypothetical protein